MDETTLTLSQFVARRRLTTVEAEGPDSTAAWNAEACDHESGEILVYPSDLVICKKGDTYWFDDYKDRYFGPLEELEAKLFELLFEGAILESPTTR